MSSKWIINRAIRDFVGKDAKGWDEDARRESQAAPILTYLNWCSSNMMSLIYREGIKIDVVFDSSAAPGERRAFKLSHTGLGVSPIVVDRELMERAEVEIAKRKKIPSLGLEQIPPQERDQLRALGYLQ